MTNIGIYLRISADPDGTQTATQRQLEDCRRYAETHGWQVADTFEDIDLSAYKRGVKRPEFERMLEAVRAHAVDGVLAWKVDRLSRRQRDLVRLDEACEEAGGFIATVVENIDSREPSGRFMAELLVSMARQESSNTSIRVSRAHAEAAAKGRASPGGYRPFGYTADRKAIIPEEAELIREGARRLLTGESLRRICYDWEQRGIRTPTGKAFSQTPLQRVLLSGLVSGQRDYKGTLTPGDWPPILTPEDTASLRAQKAAPTHHLLVGNGRNHLLSGLVRCGVCGGRLAAKRRKGAARQYICRAVPATTNCGRVSRVAEPIEEMVVRDVLKVLDGADLRAYLDRPNGKHQEELLRVIAADEIALEELSRDYYVERVITRADYFAAHTTLEARLSTNRAAVAKANGHGMLNTVVGAGKAVRAEWNDRPLDWRRSIIAALVEYVEVMPAVPGCNKFDADLIVIHWRF